MNHDCSPNIRYAYEKNSIMAVRASKKILKGEQIFNSYTKFLWGTQQRRVHLAFSKNFLCKCERCIDPAEFGSNIQALKCISPECGNMMLPVNPLVVTSPWECQSCHSKLDHARISKICDIFSKQIFNKILTEPMSAINHYLRTKLSTILPASNQFTIEVKLQIILKMKQDPNYVMTLEDYEDIEKYCYDVLEIIDRLKCGECFVKGLLYHELLTAKGKIAELKGQVFDDVSHFPQSSLYFFHHAFFICFNNFSTTQNLTLEAKQTRFHSTLLNATSFFPSQVCQIFFNKALAG
jgi:SET domain